MFSIIGIVIDFIGQTGKQKVGKMDIKTTIPGGKSIREVFEVLNHKKAIDYMLTDCDEKNDRALYMNYLREQNADIILDKVKELQEFEKKRMEQF